MDDFALADIEGMVADGRGCYADFVDGGRKTWFDCHTIADLLPHSPRPGTLAPSSDQEVQSNGSAASTAVLELAESVDAAATVADDNAS